jgi:hypothetical protein
MDRDYGQLRGSFVYTYYGRHKVNSCQSLNRKLLNWRNKSGPRAAESLVESKFSACSLDILSLTALVFTILKVVSLNQSYLVATCKRRTPYN